MIARPSTPVPALGLALVLAILASACGSSGPSPSPAAIATTSLPATPLPSTAPTPLPAADDWPVYHLDAMRTGNQLDFPPVGGPLSRAWSAKLDGAVYAEPLIVLGHVIAATENDTVYALDPATGSVIWKRNLGTPVRLSSLPCGDIDPLGITGTPAFDPTTGLLFVVAEIAGPKHVLFALDPTTGAVSWSRSVDLPGSKPITHQQRPALAVANGYVYVGLGGLAGDCGDYTGKLLGVPTNDTGLTLAYVVPVKREGAIWATAGPIVDADGNLYVATGNGSSTTKYDGSDSVLKLSPKLVLLSRFAPSTWAADNAGDLDLGSMSPVLLPGGWILAAGKRGTAYVLRQGDLGNIGGEVASVHVCAPFGGAAQVGATVYLPCRSALQEVTVGPDGQPEVGWTTPNGIGGGPPVIGGGAVWSVNVDSGGLYAIDPGSGREIAAISVGPVPHFASPTLWNGFVFVGTMSGVVAVKV